jgi:MFS family permease
MAKEEGADLGLVMGAQESFGAFGRILGPLTGGLVWDATVNGTGWVSAATAFHLCGLMMIVAFFLQMRVRTIPKGNPISD